MQENTTTGFWLHVNGNFFVIICEWKLLQRKSYSSVCKHMPNSTEVYLNPIKNNQIQGLHVSFFFKIGSYFLKQQGCQMQQYQSFSIIVRAYSVHCQWSICLTFGCFQTQHTYCICACEHAKAISGFLKFKSCLTENWARYCCMKFGW